MVEGRGGGRSGVGPVPDWTGAAAELPPGRVVPAVPHRGRRAGRASPTQAAAPDVSSGSFWLCVSGSVGRPDEFRLCRLKRFPGEDAGSADWPRFT